MQLRLAIFGDSPCDRCWAACCKQNGHEYAALLRGDEVRRFAAFSVPARIQDGANVVIEHVLPYVNGRCQFLDETDRCTVYEDRPRACRSFQCVDHFNADALGRHGIFLQRNTDVLALLDRIQVEKKLGHESHE